MRILDSELVDLLKKAGLKTAIVGVEGYDPEVLKNASRFTVTKDLQLAKIKELEEKNSSFCNVYYWLPNRYKKYN